METKKCPNVGGQALIEGVMMKSPTRKSIAIRKPDGNILVTGENTEGRKQSKLRKVPFFRGIFVLIDSMVEGMKDMDYAAGFYAEETETESSEGNFEKIMTKLFGKHAEQVATTLSMVLAIAIAVILFIVLPAFVVKHMNHERSLLASLVEGGIKITLFVGYISLISRIKEIRRVFQYHGAEHKSIFAYERGLDLTVENVAKMPRLHPRCGTNFIFVVMMVSILMFSFISFDNVALRSVLKLLLLPVVSGIAYEIIRIAGKYQNPLTRFFIMPGLLLQKITTKEPDSGQMEVAIAALKDSLGMVEEKIVMEEQEPATVEVPAV